MGFLTDIAAICGALTIVLVFVAAVARIRWVRWIWRHLVSDPLSRWLSTAIHAGAEGFHQEKVAPALERIEQKADGAAVAAEKALAYARTVAEYQGFPPGVDPTERVPVRTDGDS